VQRRLVLRLRGPGQLLPSPYAPSRRAPIRQYGRKPPCMPRPRASEGLDTLAASNAVIAKVAIRIFITLSIR
jgi:hypothetical protein